MNFAVFVTARILAFIPALWFAGWLLRQWKRCPDALIPFVLSAAGTAVGLIIEGPSLNSGIQGLLAAATAVYGHQLIKQGRRIIGG